MHLATPYPDDNEIRDNATFEAILWSMSRPGTFHGLPEPGLLAVGRALVDRECAVFANSPSLAQALRQTGARSVPLEFADHLFLALDDEDTLIRMADIGVGDPLYPDLGATVIAPATIGEGPQFRLTGPGIETKVQLRLGGINPTFWALRKHLCVYPLGFELILVDNEKIVAIPRSTTIEEV